ncbi:hypothetical protein ACROYT_G014037 [Oculina patagonica]
MPCATRNRRRASNPAVNPASLELGQLLALAHQSLVLLASARPLVTTDSKAQLAERIHAFEHANPPPAGPKDAFGSINVSPQSLMVNVGANPSLAAALSDEQITQLRSLISTAIRSERVGSQQPPFPDASSLLSPASPQQQPLSTAIQTHPPYVPIDSSNSSTGAEQLQHGIRQPSTLGPSPLPANLGNRTVENCPVNQFQSTKRDTEENYVVLVNLPQERLALSG